MESSSVRLRYAESCAPARVERVVVEALGDFALEPGSVGALAFAPASEPLALSKLPRDSVWFRLSVEQAEFRGYALIPALADGAHSDTLLLPLGRGCALPALFGLWSPGASAALAGDQLVVASFTERDGVSASRAIRRASVTVPQLERVQAGLYVPRVLSRAVSVGEGALFVGGASETSPGTRALDTFERYVGDGVSGLGRLAEARVSPAVARLADGSLLVGGGAERVGQAERPSFERIALPDGDGALLESTLPFAPVELVMRPRDDGKLWVGARSATGVRVFELDAEADAIAELDAPRLAEGATLQLATSVALPGARVAVLELGDTGTATGRVWLFLPSGAVVAVDDFLPSFAGLAPTAAEPLADGRMLVLGSRGAAAEARIIDAGRSSVAQHALPFTVGALLARSDGSLVGLGEAGVLVLREDTLTPYDNPGGTLTAEDVGVLALDAAGRFDRAGLALVAAAEGARFDVAGLRYADVEIRVRARGPAELLLVRADGATRSVAVGEGQVGPALCTLDAEPGEPVVLTRTGTSLRLRTTRGERACVLDGMTGPLRLAMRFSAGARVEELRVARR